MSSPGFAQDLGHVLERSGVGAEVRYADLPKFPISDPALEQRCVLAGGDDYELAFTAPGAARAAIAALAAPLGVALTRVGSIEAGAPRLRLLDAQGREMEVAAGFDHFA